MRFFHHDFGGSPFQFSLSQEMARRGHQVVHCYCGSLTTTPQCSFSTSEPGLEKLEVMPLCLPEPIAKQSFFKRWKQERAYGQLLSRAIQQWQPDVILSGNTPLDAQRMAIASARECNSRFVFYVQDLISVATRHILGRMLPGPGHLIGYHYERLERRLLHGSDAIVAITQDFDPIFQSWKIDPSQITVIENWAVLDEIPVRPGKNGWSSRHDLDGRFVILYSGTLGLKHNPELLVQLARHFRVNDDVRIVVSSTGKGAEYLTQLKSELGLDNLILIGFQPFNDLPDMFGASDVLFAILDREASRFSVPSKVLSYLCAGRALLLALPEDNLASRLVKSANAGFVVDPEDGEGLLAAATTLYEDAARRDRFGSNARAYAESAFDIVQVGNRFEGIFKRLVSVP